MTTQLKTILTNIFLTSGGGGGGTWGSIIGNLSDQTDLQTALNLKQNISSLGALAFLNSINNSNWSGTALADGNIASASTWNAKQSAITFGTGVQTSLGINIGSAGAPMLFNGAGGTPTSLTLTNATGLPPVTGIIGWPANSSGVLTNNGSGTLSWAASGGSGTVTTVSVVTANGFTGSVANASTTPAITLTTSVTGLLKGNATAISAATPRTDYTGSYPTVSSTASTASLTPDPTVNDLYDITALSVGLTINNPSNNGNGYSLQIRIKDNATPQTLTWDTQYRAVGGSLPTITVSSSPLYLFAEYNSTDSKWDVSISASVSGTTNQLAYFTGANSLASLTTATYPSLAELATVKGSNTGTTLQAQINALSGGGTAWLVASGGTLTAVNTISGTTPSGLIFTNTFTAAANNQFAHNFTGTPTSENVASDVLNGLTVTYNMTRNAGAPASQVANAVLINPIFTGPFTTNNILKLQNNGTDRYVFGNSVATFSNNSNSNFVTSFTNTTSGTVSQSGLNLNSSATTLIVAATSAGFTTSGVSEASTGIVQAVSGNLSLAGNIVNIWTNSTKRVIVNNNGDVAITQGAKALASGINTLIITPGAHTGVALNSELNDYVFAAANHTWADGTTTTQRWAWFQSPTILGTTTLATVTNGYTVYIDKPLAGALGAITNPYALGLAGNLKFISTNGITGTTTNDAAPVGNVAEYVTSLVATGSAVSLTTATSANVTSISLTAGDWDVDGLVNYKETTSTVTARTASTGSTSATLATDGTEGNNGVQSTVTSEVNTITLPKKRFSLSGTTTVYLVAQATFSAGTCAAYGYITARRVR